MTNSTRPARLFTVVAMLEAISWCVLLVGMYRKYGSPDDPGLVEVAGPIHGMLFMAYLAATAYVASAHRWSRRDLLTGLAAGVPPLMTVIFSRWAQARGRLAPAAAGE